MAFAATAINFAWPNKADWTVRIQCNDAESGDLIDFTDVDGINIKVRDQQGCEKLNATLGNGVEVVSDGLLEFSFAASLMKQLCPGTYNIGGVYQIDDAINQLFVGTLNIIDGVADL